MKRFILAGFTTLALAVTLTPAHAEPTAFNTYKAQISATPSLSPADLVSLANQGQFRTQGIPSAGLLTAQYQLGKISAQDLIQAAIRADRLPAETAQDASYESAVAAQLHIFNNVR